MKKSLYSIFTKTGKGVIHYNTRTDSWLFVSNAAHLCLTESLPKLQVRFPEVYDSMIQSQIIIPDEMDEFKEMLEEYENERTISSTYQLTLLPSLDCNLRCWYCFEKHIKGSRMSREISDNILKHVQSVFQKQDDLKSLQIELFGGEPLLYFEEELYPLLMQIKKYVEEIGKNVSFFFVTNAVCISDSIIPLLATLNPTFQISIDGYKEQHDKVKFRPKTKEGTYDHVIKVIHALTTQIPNTFINLRINYDDDTLLHLEDLIRDIINVDRSRIRIHLERVWQTSTFWKYANERLKCILNLFVQNDFDVSYMNFSRRSYSCKVSKERQLIISCDGTIYKCTGRDFTVAHAEGKLQEDGSVLWDREKLEKRMAIKTFDNDMCKECKFLPQCWGPCNQKQLENQNLAGYCQLNLMELSLDDFICYKFANEYRKNKRKEIVL